MPAAIQIGRATVQGTQRLARAMGNISTGNEEFNATSQSIPLDTGINSLTIVNDGAVPVRVGFDVDPYAVREQGSSIITFTGSWTSSAPLKCLGEDSQRGDASGDQFIINPGVFVNTIGFYCLFADNVPLINIEFSEDGSTWINPSIIGDVVNSLGDSGGDLDALDVSSGGLGNSFGGQLEYTLPYASSWQMRATNSGTPAPDSTGIVIHMAGASLEPTGGATFETVQYPGVFEIQPGESLRRDVRASTLHFRAEQGAAKLRILGEII